MDLERMRNILGRVEDINFTAHAKFRLEQRIEIDESMIIGNLRKPRKMVSAEIQQKGAGGVVYAVYFRKSNKYELKVVFSIDKRTLNIITAHIQNIRRRKANEKWLRKRR